MQLAARWIGGRTIMLALLTFGATVALRGPTPAPPLDGEHPTTWHTFEVCSDDYNSELNESWRMLVPSKHDREVAALEDCLDTTSGWIGDLTYRDGDVVSVSVGRFWYHASSALQRCLLETYRRGFLCGGISLAPPAHILWHVGASDD